MFTNRFFIALVIGALTAVGSKLEETERIQQSWDADTARWEAIDKYYAKQAAAQRMDLATRSYFAWGEALEATGKQGVCSDMSQENNFAGIDNSLDSATRSYIAWGLALQAKDDLRASCR